MLNKGLKRARELGGDPKKEIWLIDVGASKKVPECSEAPDHAHPHEDQGCRWRVLADNAEATAATQGFLDS